MNSWHNKLFNDELDLFWQSWPSILLSWELGLVLSSAQFAVDSLLPTLLNRDSLNLLPAAEIQSCTTFSHKNENAPTVITASSRNKWCCTGAAHYVSVFLHLVYNTNYPAVAAWLLYPMEVQYDNVGRYFCYVCICQAVNNNIWTAILGYAK